MAQFRGTIQGNRGEASRLGTKSSGLRITSNGWKSGIKVITTYDPDTNSDTHTVYATNGSSGGWYRKLIGVFADGDFKLNGKSIWEGDDNE